MEAYYASVDQLLIYCSLKSRNRFSTRNSTTNQVYQLTQNIEDSFEAKKAGAVFINLITAYDTGWHYAWPYLQLSC